jgi:hypothetical protein
MLRHLMIGQMEQARTPIEVSGRPPAAAEALTRALQQEGYAAREVETPAGCFGLELLLPLLGGAGAHLGLRVAERLEDQAVDAIADVAASTMRDKLGERPRQANGDVKIIYGPDGSVLREVKIRKDRVARGHRLFRRRGKQRR